jgi:hypothetical protein
VETLSEPLVTTPTPTPRLNWNRNRNKSEDRWMDRRKEVCGKQALRDEGRKKVPLQE